MQNTFLLILFIFVLSTRLIFFSTLIQLSCLTGLKKIIIYSFINFSLGVCVEVGVAVKGVEGMGGGGGGMLDIFLVFILYPYLSGPVAASTLQGRMRAPVEGSVGVIAPSSPSPIRSLGGVEGVAPTMAVLRVHVVHGAFLTAPTQTTISVTRMENVYIYN